MYLPQFWRLGVHDEGACKVRFWWGENPLSGHRLRLHIATLRCQEQRGESKLSGDSCKGTHPSHKDIAFMTSSNPKYLCKVPPLNSTLGEWGSIDGFWRDTLSVYYWYHFFRKSQLLTTLGSRVFVLFLIPVACSALLYGYTLAECKITRYSKAFHNAAVLSSEPHSCLCLSIFCSQRRKKQSTSDKQSYSKAKLQTPSGWAAELSPTAVDSEHGSKQSPWSLLSVKLLW